MRSGVVLLATLWLAGACVPVACSRADLRASTQSVRFSLAADPTNLNPLFLHQDASSVEQQLARLVFEPFIDFDPHGREIPELISRIPSVANGDLSPDGRMIVYRLRPQVRWSDGVPVTSEDVLFTLRSIMDPANPIPSREGYDLIDRAVARGPYVVVFHLKYAWAPAVDTLFSYGFRPQFVLPAHILRRQKPLARSIFNAAPTVGDGPYRFISWRRGESLFYATNAHYWRGQPKTKNLNILIIPDPSTNLLLLQSGELDWNLIAPAQSDVLAKNTMVAYRRTRTSIVAGLALNLSHPPLNDVRVRRALAMAIDRFSITRKITRGVYTVADTLQPQLSWARDSSVREPGFDPSAADSLLDEAGWQRIGTGLRSKNGKVLRLLYVQFNNSVTGLRVATAVQEALRRHGIDAELKIITSSQLFLPHSGVLATGNFDVAYVPFTMGPDPDDSAILVCRAASNYMRYCNTKVDALEAQTLASTSQDQRKMLYSRIERAVAIDVPIIYLFDANYIYAYQKRLSGFDPNAFLPTWNAATWRKS